MPELLGFLQMYSSWHILLLVCVLDMMLIAVHFNKSNLLQYEYYGYDVPRTHEQVVNELMQEQLKLTQVLDENIHLITNLTLALRNKQTVIEHLTKEMEKIEQDIEKLKTAQSGGIMYL
ncbi:hypothetical protein SNE40_018655 [Patella caerulea]|uniref:Uncharacterized protein n=1 Tax=Patella caerulea TaxID=87958 RepID=A0AAN8P8A9_PATCE